MRLKLRYLSILLLITLVLGVIAAPQTTSSAQEGATLTIYSGRNENLVGPLLEQFEADTGIKVEVLYGDTAELALQIVEEGENSPADVFFSQDAGALGLLAENDLLAPLSADILDLVEPRFESVDGLWVGITGRARVLVYNTDAYSPEELPASVLELTDPQWKGQIGWAPTNASFQSFVTALRVTLGDDAAKEWLEGVIANEAVVYPNNNAVVAAVDSGEVSVGLVNHYYAYGYLRENPNAKVANYFFPAGDIGSMINVAGTAILQSSPNKVLAQRFILYLLSQRGQTYFVEQTFEYPLLRYGEFELAEGLPSLDEYITPELDLSDLSSLQATLELLEEVGALEN